MNSWLEIRISGEFLVEKDRITSSLHCPTYSWKNPEFVCETQEPQDCPEDQYQCTICKTFCYRTQVTCQLEGVRISYPLPEIASLRNCVLKANEWIESANTFIMWKQKNTLDESRANLSAWVINLIVD